MKKPIRLLGVRCSFGTFTFKICIMASVKWSALVSEVKGVLNGSILSVGYGGQTIRNRISGGGRKTVVWSYSKSYLAFISQRWRGLTSSDQTAWAVMAPDYPYTDKFGNSQIPSGYQLYCTLNLNLLHAGFDLIDVPVAPLTPENIGTPFVINPSPGNLEVEWTPVVTDRTIIMVYISPPLSPGKTSPPRTLQLIALFNSGTSSPQDIVADYVRRYGNIPSYGRVFWRIQQIDGVSGQRYNTVDGIIDLV